MTPYENLANEIIVQAYKDYIEYYKHLKKVEAIDTSQMDEKALKRYEKKLKKAQSAVDDILDFFYSRWFGILSKVDPQIILNKLDEEVSAL